MQLWQAQWLLPTLSVMYDSEPRSILPEGFNDASLNTLLEPEKQPLIIRDMKLVIRDDVHSLAGYAASQVAAAINAAKKAGKPCVLGLPVGNTMLQTYATLATMHKRGEVDFAHVVGFVLDEYCGVDVADARSHHHYIYANFASQVNIKRENLHVLDGGVDREAWADECAAYEAKIAAAGGFDLVFCSTGGDGHVARNEPGSSLKSRTRPKTLAHDTKSQLAERWKCPVGDVSSVALTVGVGTIMGARRVLVLFASVHRAYALERCLEHGINHMFPVSMLQQHPEVTFACDEDATFELRVKTVKYFKGLEASSFLR